MAEDKPLTFVPTEVYREVVDALGFRPPLTTDEIEIVMGHLIGRLGPAAILAAYEKLWGKMAAEDMKAVAAAPETSTDAMLRGALARDLCEFASGLMTYAGRISGQSVSLDYTAEVAAVQARVADFGRTLVDYADRLGLTSDRHYSPGDIVEVPQAHQEQRNG